MKTLSIAILAFGTAAAAFAQISTINSVKVFERFFNDCPTSSLTTTNNYPSLFIFDDQKVNSGGFANMHKWEFSNDNGATSYAVTNDTYFETFTSFKLESSVNGTRKETGYRITTIGGDGQFIINNDALEVVVFGGPFPFYRFPFDYVNGTTIRLGFRYFKDTDGKRKVIYFANGVQSPALEFTNLEQGIIDGSTVGAYLQIAVNVNDPNNFGKSTMTDIQINPLPTNPSAYSIFRGSLVSGTLNSLLESDDDYLVVRNGPVALPSEAPITIIFDGTSTATNPSFLRFMVENKVSINNLTQQIDLYNWTTNAFVQLDSRSASTTDQTVTVSGAPGTYIQTGTKAVRARLRVRPSGPLFTNNWRTSVDRAVWFIE